jgi:hypothetical protein
MTNSYLRVLEDIVDENLGAISRGGFLAIQTKDVRINGYIEPLAKQIVDNLGSIENLWLKEIVVVTPEKIKQERVNSNPTNLQITHQYTLVYEVI